MEENKRDRRKTGLLLSILGVISLVLITAGVTYAFFSYAKEGQTENVITTGTIKFAYNEVEANGSGILMEDALPLDDATGMALDGTANSGKSFHFTVTSETPSSAYIPYVVTVRKTSTSSIANDQVKLYLVAQPAANKTGQSGNGNTYADSMVKTFAQLPTLENHEIVGDLYDTVGDAERIIFEGEVPARANNYQTEFTLRMWLNGAASNTGADYSPYEFMLVEHSTPVSTQVGTDGNDDPIMHDVLTADTGYTDAINAEQAIRDGKFITSTAYYAKNAEGSCSDTSYTTKSACLGAEETWTTGKNEYERIAYVNTTAKTVLTRSQAVKLGYATVDQYDNYTFANETALSFATTEQYYQINGQTFTVKVNVYAQGAKVAEIPSQQPNQP